MRNRGFPQINAALRYGPRTSIPLDTQRTVLPSSSAGFKVQAGLEVVGANWAESAALRASRHSPGLTLVHLVEPVHCQPTIGQT
ncbi:hypothetical protein PIB30_081234 [Stylosanthes scabra]|uniref:Uncharacterized protein n=1 Tax=Stylosanthes scabra TaxID=79078 RepID=A0ABU6UR35_9FABA|nr:hypothetical protein [Stylosanthes scabra]